MDKNEYWLLDSVVEGWYSLRWLVAKNVAELLNKPSHGLNRDELVSVLDRLFQRGDLLAQRMEKSVSKGFFIPTQTEIEEAFDGRLSCFYGLTSQGGARWEEVSRPQWERYISAWACFDPPESEIVSSDRQMVEKYYSLSEYLLKVSAVPPGSQQWDVLEPWQATYWKILPLGHRVRFNCEPVDPAPEPSRDLAAWEWLNEIYNWYTRDPELK